MNKPDRFEKMAEQEYQTWLNGDMSQRGWLQVAERCQRRQYAALRRLVKKQMSCDVYSNRYVYKAMLFLMDEWKKGAR